MRAIDVVQGSPEWMTARCGKITSSRISDVLAKLKTKKDEAACRREYKVQLIAERLTGQTTRGYVSPEMQWGTEQEPFARAAYEIARGVDVEQVGFVLHPVRDDIAGCSPDGLVGSDGLIEIKCPKTTTHVEYVMDGVPPLDYMPQMLWMLACTGRKWIDFISYDPRLPEHLQLFIAPRIVRDEKIEQLIQAAEAEVWQFNSEIVELMENLQVPA